MIGNYQLIGKRLKNEAMCDRSAVLRFENHAQPISGQEIAARRAELAETLINIITRYKSGIMIRPIK